MGAETLQDAAHQKNGPAAVTPIGQSAPLNAPKVRKPKSVKAKKPKRNKRPPRAVRLSQAERRLRQPAPPRLGISVTIQTPGWKLPLPLTRRLPHLPPGLSRFRKHIRYPLPLAAGLTLVAVIVFVSLPGGQRTAAPAAAKTPAVRSAPDFQPLVPSASEASAPKFDGTRDVVSYEATFSGVRLAVSQQPLPARLAASSAAVQAAADSINAKERIDTAKGPLYLATNEQGDQLAMFAGQKVLVFVHADRKLDTISWRSFIELLAVKGA